MSNYLLKTLFLCRLSFSPYIGTFYLLTLWSFCIFELLTFAQAVKEMSRKSQSQFVDSPLDKLISQVYFFRVLLFTCDF